MSIAIAWPSFILNISFCSEEKNASVVHSHQNFVNYVLHVASLKVEAMRSAPEYLQIKFSKSNFQNLCEISSIVYTKLVSNLEAALDNFDELTAFHATDCFLQCLTSAVSLYDRKFKEFLTKFVRSTGGNREQGAADGGTQMVQTIQRMVDFVLENDSRLEEDESKLIPLKLVQILELVLDHAALDDKFGMNVRDIRLMIPWFHSLSGLF